MVMKIRLAFFLSLLVVVLFALSATAEEIFSLPANTRIIEEEAFFRCGKYSDAFTSGRR